MFGWTKKTKKEIEALRKEEIDQQYIPKDDENEVALRVNADFLTAETARRSDVDETELSVEDNWEDEYRLYKGGGLQWVTNFAYRSKRARQIRPNSEDNFIFNTLQTQMSNITSNVPEVCISGIDETDEENKKVAQKVTHASRFNDERNNFIALYKKWVNDFCISGPTIGMVIWDNDWMGGSGPNRWVGDVRLLRIDKWEMYFDPAIKDLEENLQDCSYIIRRPRKKLSYIRSRWDKGKYVGINENEDHFVNEGEDPNQTYLIEYWHRGFPYFMPTDRAKELREQAFDIEQEDYYKAQDYYDAAKGLLEGVHVAYIADGVLLEYRPYEYDDGLYPFVFTTKYFDDKNPWGFGEVRNLKIPQIMHNKADEIELEAMCKEGLGGHYYQKGAISPNQLRNMTVNSAKGGMNFEVDNVNLIKPREGVKVPQSIIQYKQNKERIINAIQPATTIQQGISPGANVPYSTVKELGNRTDVRMKQASDKLEEFLIRVNKLRLNRFVQFYTEERYYRTKGADGKVIEGTIQASDMMQEWDRGMEGMEGMQDMAPMEQSIPMEGMENIGQPNPMEMGMEDMGQVLPFPQDQMQPQQPMQQKEKFVPEFEIKVTIMSEKPTDRNYYTQLAMQLHQMQLLGPEDLLYTLEEGKMPQMEEILKHLYARQPIMQVLSEIQNLPPELQQHILDAMKQAVAQTQQMVQGQMQEQQMMEQMQGQQQ